MIEAGRHTGALSPDSKLRPDKSMLWQLHNAGREETRKWLGRHIHDIGHRSTIDLGAHFLAPFANLPALIADAADAASQGQSAVPVPNL